MFSIEEYVTASRTGENGKLKLVSMVDLMQDCSQLWMQSEPTLNQYFSDNNMSQLLVSRQLDIKRIPVYGEKLTTTTSIYECQSMYGFRNTVIYDEQHKPCVVSWSMGAFVSLSTNRMAKVPQDILTDMVMDEKIDMEYLDRKIVIPTDTKLESLDPFKVLKNDIDMNKHMNNAHYIRLAVEYLPDNYKPRRMRIEYKLPAKFGDEIYSSILKMPNDKIYISLKNKSDKLYSVIEFSK